MLFENATSTCAKMRLMMPDSTSSFTDALMFSIPLSITALGLVSVKPNAVLRLGVPIVEVTIVNPYNMQDFLDDKLSILDIKASDANGAIYDIEMQVTIFEGLVQRVVFYGCEMYAGQLNAGDDYAELNPVYCI